MSEPYLSNESIYVFYALIFDITDWSIIIRIDLD